MIGILYEATTLLHHVDYSASEGHDSLLIEPFNVCFMQRYLCAPLIPARMVLYVSTRSAGLLAYVHPDIEEHPVMFVSISKTHFMI